MGNDLRAIKMVNCEAHIKYRNKQTVREKGKLIAGMGLDGFVKWNNV